MAMVISIFFLVILEGLLSFDNALALAALCKHLNPQDQKKALTYGMIGAFVFRILALFFLELFLQSNYVKIAGGAYLLYLGLKNLYTEQDDAKGNAPLPSMQFWRVILMVELTDMIFSIDSIFAGVAVSSKTWVVVTGALIGIIMMRFAAVGFIKLIDIFPRLEQSAFVLVIVIGLKLLIEAFPGYVSVDFENTTRPEFWALWFMMFLGLSYGFTKRSRGDLSCSSKETRNLRNS